MNEEILCILHEQGPRSIDQLHAIILCDLDLLCECLAFLILTHQVYLEVDSTVWFAQEVAA
jgi:hypothetical protein|tara:strand:+ start:438 stop:620 length:183 start_codon:yes stop_codon:yes gene_type:complete